MEFNTISTEQTSVAAFRPLVPLGPGPFFPWPPHGPGPYWPFEGFPSGQVYAPLSVVFTEGDRSVFEQMLAVYKRYPGAKIPSEQDRSVLLTVTVYGLGYFEGKSFSQPEPALESMTALTAPRGELAETHGRIVKTLETITNLQPMPPGPQAINILKILRDLKQLRKDLKTLWVDLHE
jgi:hypothetical protein